MADSPFTSKASEKRTSLAEMAARAAQRTSRPPPAPSVPPSSRTPGAASARNPYIPPSYAPPSSVAPPAGAETNGSGLINLGHISQAPTLSPAVRTIDPRTVTPSTPVNRPSVRSAGSGSRMVLAGVVVALVGIGAAYGLTSQNGSDVPVRRGAALSEHPAAVQAAAVAVVPPSAPAVEAPAVAAPVPVAVAPAVEKVNPALEKVNKAPGAIAPSDATEISRAATPRAGKSGKGRKGAAAAAAPANPSPAAPAAAAGPSPGAAAIAAAMAAEGVPASPPPPAAAPAAAAPAPAAPAAPEPTGLAGAIKKAAGPTEPAPPPEKAEAVAKAAPVRGDIPELPAQGAISGALGSPRTAARNCIVGQDAPSRATIVFASSGSVQSVSVTGPAAGTPAEACIKTAMSKTVVGPFKHPTFSVSTTISPP
jgi:hypothetical protein